MINPINNNTNNDFEYIFDGKSLDGWQMAGQGRFIVVSEDEGVLQSEGGMGLLWYTKQKYCNFILKLDWRVLHKGDNSGIFIRFPDPDDDLLIAVNNGYEIQIDDLAQPDGNPVHQTGAIYGFAAPAKIVTKPVGQWNSIEIKVMEQKYIVTINNEKTTEFVGNRSIEGYIGLQNHDTRSKVSFRNIRIQEK
jgi:hypothetical protein